MATSRPKKPSSSNQSKATDQISRPRRSIVDKSADKKQDKENLKKRIEIELYKLNQDVIIQRMSVRDELFGDSNDLNSLVKSMEKYEEEKLKKQNITKKGTESSRPKMDIKLKLIKREE